MVDIMKYTYKKLIRFNRLLTGNITELEWHPADGLTVILGGNGSGKSSLLSRLTMLPARHVAFAKGGEEITHCEAKGFKYETHSKYGTGTGWHSFKRNGEELNQGHTFRVQEELCYQEFGITPELHDIATGRLQFSSFTTNKRRELLTKMSVVDLSYAFDVHAKLRQEHRSHKGVMDLITKRLVSENTETLSDNEVTVLQDRTKSLTNRLNRLYSERINGLQPAWHNDSEATAKLAELVERSKALLKRYPKIPSTFVLKGQEALTNHLELLRTQQSNTRTLITHMAEELDVLKQQTPKDLSLQKEDASVLTNELNQLVLPLEKLGSIIDKYDSPLPLIPTDPNTSGLKETLNTMVETWISLISEFPDNHDSLMSRKNATEHTQLIEQLRHRRNSLQNSFESIAGRLSRLKGCSTVVCPDCTHEFQPGVGVNEVAELEVRQITLEVQLVEVESTLGKSERYMSDFNDYSTLVTRYVNLTRTYPQYQKLWDWVAESRLMFTTPTNLKLPIYNWASVMEATIEFGQFTQKANHLRERLKVLEEIDHDALSYISRKIESISQQLDDKYITLGECNNSIEILQAGEYDIRSICQTVDSILQDYETWRKQVRQQAEWLLDKAYDAEINEIHLNIADNTKTLNTVFQHKTTIRTLENEVANANEAHKELGLLIKSLSPNDGLLGKYLSGFMRGVTTLVNAYIGEVWTYPLEVLPSKVAADELDYKFPVIVNNNPDPSPDIVDTSTGQLEIINFAFRMAILKFLGLEQMPLYLDELGGAFDDQHRSNLIPFVTGLIENGLFNQVFYICHFEETYGAFNQADYLVVSPSNITTPENFNKNVNIH